MRDGPPILIHLIRVARRLKSMTTAVDAVRWTLTAGCVGSGLLSGLYFIFSFCVMQSLNEQPPSSAIATMNTINVRIVNPAFMVVFMGTPLAAAWILQRCIKEGVRSSPDNLHAAAGALLLLVGEFLLTLVLHIPKNDALAAYAAARGGDDALTWSNYYTSWTAWNHVRMIASIAACALWSSALHLRGARLAGGLGAASMQ